MFPKVQFFFARNSAAEYTVETLRTLARAQCVVLDWNDEARRWAPDGLTAGQWLRRENPAIQLLAYIPASYWWKQADMSPESSPHRVAVQKQLWAKGWWATELGGDLLEPWPDQPLLIRNGVEWLTQYVASHYDGDYWDGVHLDVLVAEWWHLTAPRELSRELLAGCVEMAQKLGAAGILVQGNGSWAPSTEGFATASPYLGALAGVFVEKWPSLRWYDGATPGGKPDADQAWAWHMQLAAQWLAAGAAQYAFHADGLVDHAYFGRWIKSEAQAMRWVLGSACLAGAWFTPPMRSTPRLCAEMFVVDGKVSKLDGAAWLGRPVSDARQVGTLWRREFEHGIVVVNPTTMTAGMMDLGGEYRRLADGELMTTLTLGAMDACLLWRAQPEPKPEPEPDELTALRARVDMMDADLARVERRLDALEAMAQAAAEAWRVR